VEEISMPGRILIVDDDQALQDLLVQSLEREGFQVAIATTGRAALKTAQAEPRPNLILLDVGLPGMDGYQVAQNLQGQPETVNIPIIFLTANDTLKDRITGFEVGGIDYLAKPFDIAELIARIKANLHRSKVEHEKAQRDLEAYKNNLSENMGHELLTPVNKVLNGLDLLTRLTLKENITQFDGVIEIIRSGADELRWLLEDLLLMNQIADNRLGPFRQPTDLSESVKVMVQQTKAKYARKNLAFQVDIPKQHAVNMHRKHLYHILHHLLDNAAKFSPEGSQLKVAIKAIGEAGAEIETRDQGKGINPELLEKVFEKFYQVDMSMTRQSGGLGLGLYIARTLARTYDGDVTLTSQPNGGITSHFIIPDIASDQT
jgi:signal transduction histidine kinase